MDVSYQTELLLWTRKQGVERAHECQTDPTEETLSRLFSGYPAKRIIGGYAEQAFLPTSAAMQHYFTFHFGDAAPNG